MSTRLSGGEIVGAGNEAELSVDEDGIRMVEIVGFEVIGTVESFDVTWLDVEERAEELSDAGAIVLEAFELDSSRGAVEGRFRDRVELSEDVGIVDESVELYDTLVADEVSRFWLDETARSP